MTTGGQKTVRLLLLRLNFYILTVSTFYFYQLPAGVCAAGNVYGFDKSECLFPCEVDAVIFAQHRRKNGGDGVEYNAGGEADIYIFAVRIFDYDTHGLLHKYAYGVAVRTLYLQQISHKALFDEFNDF